MMHKITIAVSEAGIPAARTFAYRITIDGEEVFNRVMTPVQSMQVKEMAAQFHSLFRVPSNARAIEYLPIIGDGLFHLFLEAGWKNFGERFFEGGDLIISSSISEVLELPWEYLRLAKTDAIAASESFNILRHPLATDSQSDESTKFAEGPLRVLFLATEPSDYEPEELGMLKVIEGQNIVLKISDTATIDELKDLAMAFQPNVVHLATNVKMLDGDARISMQDMGGKNDLRSAKDIVAILMGSGANLIIIGCVQNEAFASMELFCQKLVEHLPLAIAWNGPTSTTQTFYQHLADGKSINESLRKARQDMHKTCLEQLRICALPVMYVGPDQLKIQDSQEKPESVAAKTTAIRKKQISLPGLYEGYVESFVNRRKDMRHLLSNFTEGRMHTLIITGPKGVGKSTLALNLAIRMASSGYSILPVFSSKYNPLSIARLLEVVSGQLSKTGQSEIVMRLKEIPPKNRSRFLMEVLKENRFLIIWDDLELDSKTGKIMNTDIAEFYLQMLQGLGAGRVIITSEKVPLDVLTLPKRTLEWRLSGLSKAAFMRFLLEDETIAERYRKGEISYEKLQEVHSKANLEPASLGQVRQALKMGESCTGGESLIFLFASLGKASRLALSKCAVYNIAFSLEGLAIVAGVSWDEALTMANDWKKLSLADHVGNLWALPSTSRDYLLTTLTSDETRSAHEAAGDFLKNIAESGRSAELVLSRLDSLMEARGHYLDAADLENAQAVTARISGYLERHGYYQDLINLNQELLMWGEHAVPMNWIAQGYSDLGDFKRAIESYERIIRIGPDPVALYGLGTIYQSMGKLDLARESLQKAMDIWQGLGDLRAETAVLQRLVSLDIKCNEDNAAREKLKKLLEIQEKLGDLRGVAATLQEMAKLDLALPDYEAARSKILKSLEIIRKTKDLLAEAVSLFNLGNLDMERKEYQLAKEDFESSLRLEREIGNRTGEAAALHSLGLIESQLDAKEAAWNDFREALEIYQGLSDKSGEAGAFFQLGAQAVQRDKIAEGLRLMAISALILRSVKSDEVKNVEPMVERLASNLGYTQEQFIKMVQEVMQSYHKDRGWSLVERGSFSQ